MPLPLPFWGQLSLFRRLLITTSLALLLSGAALLLVSAHEEATQGLVDLQAQLVSELDTLPLLLADALVVGDYATVQQALDRYTRRPLMRTLTFTDATGISLRGEAVGVRRLAPDWFASFLGFADLTGSAAVEVGGRTYGELSLTLSAQGQANRSWGQLKNHLSLLTFALALAFLGFWLVLRSGLAPLKQLEVGANAMADGQFDVELVPYGSPEVRHLTESFARMAKSVQAAQSDLKSTLKAIPDLLLEQDLDGRIYRVQSPRPELLVCAPEVMVGQCASDVLPPEAAAIRLLALQEAHEKGFSTGHQYALKLGRERRWFELSVARKEGGQDRPGRFVVLARDITPRKAVEHQLQQAQVHLAASQELLARLSQHLPGMIFQYQLFPDGHGAFPYASAGIREIYEVTAAQVRDDAEAVFAAIHQDDLEPVITAIKASARTMHLWRQQFRVNLPHKGLRWLSGLAQPERLEDGSVLWHGFTCDITEQKKIEARLQLAASVFTHVREGILITDARGIIVDVNTMFTRVTGYSRDEALGQTPRLLKSGRQSVEHYTAMWKMLAEKGHWHGETWNRRKNGEVYLENVTISAVRDDAGAIRNYVATYAAREAGSHPEQQLAVSLDEA